MQTNSSSQALWVHSIAAIAWELQQLQIALWRPAGHSCEVENDVPWT